MKRKFKKIFTNTRVIILVAFLLLSFVAIRPSFGIEGVAIRSVLKNSSAEISGIENPDPGVTPRSREVIFTMNNDEIKNLVDYEDFVSTLVLNQTVKIETNKGYYTLITKPEYKITYLPELEEVTYQEVIQVNETINDSLVLVDKIINKTRIQNKTLTEVVGVEDLGLKVFDAPTTNIRKGLDLQGGTRVLLQPEEKLSNSDMETVIDQMKQRLNVYGLSDLVIKEASDLPPPLGDGNQYVMVEVAGVNEEEVKDLLSKQGKFEAKIGDEIAFRGGDDITYVCRSADCSGIDPRVGCTNDETGNTLCRFRFTISLSQSAAKNQASITDRIGVVTVDTEGNPLPVERQYLDKPLDLYLDDEKVDSLNIGKDLKGSAVTNIQISGSGSGTDRQSAIIDALQNMKSLQTVLVTGSLPVKLNIVKVDTSSPLLGEKFTKNAVLIGILAILSVASVVFIRYKSLNVVIPIIVTMSSEVILLLGLAALIGWNLDLAAVAGIIIAVGTGVDDQIVITDEIKNKEKRELTSWRQKIKGAFFIIMAAYFTTLVAMLPLWFAGAGLLKGFAITTIFGVSFGVFITRPAFAKILEILEKE